MTAAGATRPQGPAEPIPLTRAHRLPRRRQDHAAQPPAAAIRRSPTPPSSSTSSARSVSIICWSRPIDDNMVLLQSGCLCCTLRGDLVKALENLLRDLDNGRISFRRVILETTGLADPAPVLQTAMAHPYLVMRFRLDGVITVVDAVNGGATLDAASRGGQAGRGRRPHRADQDRSRSIRPAPRRQARSSWPGCMRSTRPRPSSMPPPARRRLRACSTAACTIRRARFPTCGAGSPRKPMRKPRHHHHQPRPEPPRRAHPRLHARDRYADPGRHLRDVHRPPALAARPKLLRLKGIVKIAETPEQPLVIHGVQHVLHPPVQLERWPDADRAHPHRADHPRPRTERGHPAVRRVPQSRRARPARPRGAPRQPAGAVRRRRPLTPAGLATSAGLPDAPRGAD